MYKSIVFIIRNILLLFNAKDIFFLKEKIIETAVAANE